MPLFERVLIANRGEIAVRVIRACRRLGIESVAVYSTADANSLHVELADQAVCIGPAPARDSYLQIPAIIAAAEITGADAIHPGYGFLSESAKFAAICRECALRFVGPGPRAIELSGDKAACRDAVKGAGVPTVPGSEGRVQNINEALKLAGEYGYPVLVKAAAGGGGKGMRPAHSADELRGAFNTAAHEAQNAFGDGGLYIEKFVPDARHVEVQVLADEHGNVATLGERECTIQRRHQKLIEETPCVALSPAQREAMCTAAYNAARAIDYANAGTVEFLLGPDGDFYFIEFNARIQVEHPVTEEVTGVDLVAMQLRVAAGETIDPGAMPAPQGAAIEARVYAEDPERNFAPSPGTIHTLHLPGGPGIRVDTHLRAGLRVPPHYDSMLAKIIARGTDRAEATARLAGALDEFRAEGVKHTAALGARILRHEAFVSGNLSPSLLAGMLADPA